MHAVVLLGGAHGKATNAQQLCEISWARPDGLSRATIVTGASRASLLRMLKYVPTCAASVAGMWAVFVLSCSDDEPTCASIATKVEAMISNAQTCEADTDCEQGPSFDCFVLCGSSVNRSIDLDALQRETRKLTDHYRDLDCACAIADCADPRDFEPACVEHKCTLIARRGASSD